MTEVAIYTSKKGKVNLEVSLVDETVWLSMNQLKLLFNRDKSSISKHLSNIFKSKELSKNSVVAKFATTAEDGKTYQVEYYNLDAIISLGYRVSSKEGIAFRKWATQVLKDHLIQGYTTYDKRLSEIGVHELQQAITSWAKNLANLLSRSRRKKNRKHLGRVWQEKSVLRLMSKSFTSAMTILNGFSLQLI